MGAWGVGPYENDDALDWFGEFSATPTWNGVRRALRVGRAQRGNLEEPEASVIVAAAALTAAARAGRVSALPEGGAELLVRLGDIPDDLPSLAIEALALVQADSELAELWAEGDDASAWIATLDVIRADLA